MRELSNVYILVYFIYGLAFFTMGISILQNKVEKGSTFLLLNSMKFLGFFGLTHGVTEWILMIIISDIYPNNRIPLFILASFLNSLSFACLLYFGIVLMGFVGRVKIVPWIIFMLLWACGLIYSIVFHEISDHLFLLINLMSRYFIGLPASIFTAIALYKSIELIEMIKLDKISRRIKGLAISFFVYGILAGIFVRKTEFFPSNYINAEVFRDITGLPIELARAITAVIITFLSVSIIELFRWENKQKLTRLIKHELMNDEKRRLCQNLHDVIIQNLFATGLKIESIIDEIQCDYYKKNLSEVNVNLNEAIFQIREYISKINVKRIDIEGLKNKISDLIIEFENSSGHEIDFFYDITDIVYNQSPSEKLTEIYFITQEAINNAIKHAEADKIVVSMQINLQAIYVKVVDNGCGFKVNNTSNTGYGITSMNERALAIEGFLSINSNEKGTEISLVIPWRAE